MKPASDTSREAIEAMLQKCTGFELNEEATMIEVLATERDAAVQRAEKFTSMVIGYEETVGELHARLAAATQRCETLERAAQIAHHDLVTTHNLRATDLDVETFNAHIDNGVARDTLEWMTDNSKGIDAINAALTTQQAPAQSGETNGGEV